MTGTVHNKYVWCELLQSLVGTPCVKVFAISCDKLSRVIIPWLNYVRHNQAFFASSSHFLLDRQFVRKWGRIFAPIRGVFMFSRVVSGKTEADLSQKSENAMKNSRWEVEKKKIDRFHERWSTVSTVFFPSLVVFRCFSVSISIKLYRAQSMYVAVSGPWIFVTTGLRNLTKL